MDKTKYKKLFEEIIRIKHKRDIDFEKIEDQLNHLREGAALTYEALEIMGDDSCWPFSKYWMWPAKDQIEKGLAQTSGWFAVLPTKEKEIIKKLVAIFKNIALVSIILRFVHPNHYAIYSRPPLKILRIERGINDVTEYLNYLQVMRALRISFGVVRTADVDTIVWATAFAKGEYLAKLKQILAENLPENLTLGEVINYWNRKPLRVAELYLNRDDHETAGFWTARAFEQILNLECDKCLRGSFVGKENEIKRKVELLSKTAKYRSEFSFLDKLRRSRNKAIHASNTLTKDDIRKFFEATRRFENFAKS